MIYFVYVWRPKMQKDIISLTVPPCFRKCPFYTLKTRSRPFSPPPKLPKGAFLVIFEVSKIALSVKDQITPKHEKHQQIVAWWGECVFYCLWDTKYINWTKGSGNFLIFIYPSVRTILQLIRSLHFIGKLGPPRRYQSKEMLDFVFTGTVCWDETQNSRECVKRFLRHWLGPLKWWAFYCFCSSEKMEAIRETI